MRWISMTAGPMAGAPAACTFARPASSQAQSLSQPPGIKVPGSGASTFSGVGFFKGALRRILDTSSGFGYFARSLVSHSYAQDCTTTPRADGFPMPLPYVEVMKPGLDDSAAGGEIALKRGVNSIILALNYLHLGRPRRVPACIKLGSKLSRRQWEMVRVIKEFARVWVEISPIGPSEMGRGASKVESMEGLLDELSARASSFGLSCEGFYGSHRFTESSRASSQALPTDAAGSVVGRSSRSGIAAFQPIEPSRLQFLGTPSFDPRPFMDPLTRAIYEDPIAFAIPFEQYGGVLPRVRVHCSYHKKIQLFKLLDQTKRLTLQAPAHVDPQLCAGLFSVVKSATRDRLILDARPRNCLEIPIERWIGSLAGGEALVNIVLPPACELRVSSNDLRDFYYFFSVGGARASRNIFAGAVRTQDLQGFNALKSEHSDLQYVYGSLNSLAMGDLQAVAIAQTCHLGLGIQHGIFDPRSLLTSKGPVPRGPEYYGIVIDDYVSISAVPSSSPGPTKASKQADKIVDVYQKVHLLPHEEKATRDQVISEFWGVHLDGSRGQLRGSLKRSVPLAHIAMDVARLGYCSVDLMQTTIGSFISLLLFRRRLLAILNALFQTVRGREPHDIVRLSGEARSELLLLALLLPVACTNLRAPVSPRVTATDASQWGEGAVEAHLPEQIAREVHRLVLRKPVWTKLLTPGKAWERIHGLLEPHLELPEGEEHYKSNPLWETLAEVLEYREIFSTAASRPRHINVGELKAVIRAESRLGRMHGSTRELFGIDSQVTLGCLIKGRSSSRSLNQVLAQSVPNMIGYDVYSEPMYFETSRNRADGPSRGSSVPAPSRQVPGWWASASRGDFRKFDRWRAHFGISDHDLRGLPSFSELNQGVPLRADRLDPEDEFSGGEEFSCSKPSVRREQVQEEDFGIRKEASCFREVAEVLGSFPRSQIEMPPNQDWPPVGPGYLDLYSGSRGVPRSLRLCGAAWVLCFDVSAGLSQDLAHPPLRRKIEWLLKSGAFLGVGAGPPCSSFSTAVTPPVRSSDEPYGKASASEKMKIKIREGNDHALWVLNVIQMCIDEGLGFWIENPATSWLFKLPEWQAWIAGGQEVGFWTVDYCRFGAPWRKRTKFLTNLDLRNQTCLCQGGHKHLLLRGRSTQHSKAWTLVAQPYPRKTAKTVAAALISFSQVAIRGGVASCAKQSCLRIGEAKNPGPAKRAPRDRSAPLASVPLVSGRTRLLQEKVWPMFTSWLGNQLSTGALTDVFKSPSLVALFLAEFASELYKTGKPMHLYRHLCALAQRKVLGIRPYMGPCWDMLSRWEVMEPTEHRVPVPVAIVEAMICVALSWRWTRFAAALALIFFGIARPGEVLRALRRHLVLPRDLLAANYKVCYLRIEHPKGSRKGKGRLQHLSVQRPDIVLFLDKVFGAIDESLPLYPSSASSFRRRWNWLLAALGIDSSAGLIPGGLRGGGAVYAFHCGESIPGLLWRMRLKHLATLESYLQEVTALAVVPLLTPSCRSRITAAAALLPAVLQALAS